ncbi:unnamed protein product [Caenorhabditis nigoni]
MIPPIEQNGYPKREIYIKNGNYENSIYNAVQVTKDDGTVGWLSIGLRHFSQKVKLLVVNSPSNVREKIIPPPIPESDSEEDSEHEEVPVDVN